MAMASLNNKRFKYRGKSYFVAGAHECQVGSAGEKRSPLGKPKNLDVRRQIKPEKIGELRSRVIEVDLDVTKGAGINALIPLTISGIPLPVDADVLGGKVTKGQLKLVQIWAPESQLKNAANESPRLLNDLIDWGRDARLVNEIFVVVEADLAEKFRTTESFSIGASLNGFIGAKVGGAGGRAGSVEVTLSPDSVFAYQLADIVWDAKAKKKRKRIEKLPDDQYGTG